MTETFPLQSCRMFASKLSLGDHSFRGRNQPRNSEGPGLWTAVETDAAARAVVACIARRMHPVRAQFRGKLQAFRRARLHTQPASFALFDIDRYIAACWACHVSSPRCCGLYRLRM